jgi:hypothetical protein
MHHSAHLLALESLKELSRLIMCLAAVGTTLNNRASMLFAVLSAPALLAGTFPVVIQK